MREGGREGRGKEEEERAGKKRGVRKGETYVRKKGRWKRGTEEGKKGRGEKERGGEGKKEGGGEGEERTEQRRENRAYTYWKCTLSTTNLVSKIPDVRTRHLKMSWNIRIGKNLNKCYKTMPSYTPGRKV